MGDRLPLKSTRNTFSSIYVLGTSTLADNVVTGSYIWQKGRNRVYYQNLNYATTTSTVPVVFASIIINPEFSGHIVIDSVMRANNLSQDDGLQVAMVVNGATLVRETYISAKPVVNNEAALPFHYELTEQTIGGTLVVALNHNIYLGGTCISRLVSLIAEEI